MNRSDITTILADISDTMDRVRDLSVSPNRAAALQCLADAAGHLQRAAERPVLASVPPGCADGNKPTRERASQAFRNARQILAGIK